MKTVFIESDLSSFEDFHDKEWIEKIIKLAKDTDIDEIVEGFVLHWWGNARAFILPWLLVNGVYDSVYNLIPFSSDKSRQDVFNEYLKHDEFRAALWKLTENTYCSLYYAYENLIVNALSRILKIRVRVTDDDFNKKLIKVYGDKFANRIWNNSYIAVSREIRNCIVHNGGKVSERLSKMKPLPYLGDGDILISASDTRKLYESLKSLVLEILELTLGKLIEAEQKI